MNREQISTLMDGELDNARAEALCGQLKSDESCEWWATYHMIGDALRNECVTQSGFARRFAERLASEPTVLAPGLKAHSHTPSPASTSWSNGYQARPWYYGMAAAAAVAAVGLVGWFGAQEFSLGPALSEQASASSPAFAGAGARMASIAVNAQSSAALSRRSQFRSMDPYLLVHQEYSPTTAMQGVRPYVRAVADATAAE
ncbi:MAG: sigma-E factor negative regulatory protein [Betaproteobacteria bacterium]